MAYFYFSLWGGKGVQNSHVLVTEVTVHWFGGGENCVSDALLEV